MKFDNFPILKWFRSKRWIIKQNELYIAALRGSITSLEVANRLDPPHDQRLVSIHYRNLWIVKQLVGRL